MYLQRLKLNSLFRCKGIENISQRTIEFFKNLRIKQVTGLGVIMTQCVQKDVNNRLLGFG